jgi:hypothetical protein
MLSGMHGKPLREQLIQARAKIQREIDILRTPAIIGFPNAPNPKKTLIEKLKTELQELDEALAGLGSDDA